MDSGDETVDEGTKVMGTAELTVLDMVCKQSRKDEVSTSEKVKEECKW